MVSIGLAYRHTRETILLLCKMAMVYGFATRAKQKSVLLQHIRTFDILRAMTAKALLKQMEKKGFVMVPRDEYEELITYKRFLGPIKEYTPTKAELRDLARARKNYREGKTMSFDEFSKKLGFKNR